MRKQTNTREDTPKTPLASPTGPLLATDIKVTGQPLHPDNAGQIIKLREFVDIIEITPLNRAETVLYNQLLGHAWNEIRAKPVHKIRKSVLRGSHESNDRLLSAFATLFEGAGMASESETGLLSPSLGRKRQRSRPACSSPAGDEGDMVYNVDYKTVQFCDGTNWISMAGGGGGGTLNDLTDVVISSPSANQALVYNGATWTNTTLTVTENDPQVGTVTANKWCAANTGGTAIDCTTDAPTTGAAGSASEVQFRNSSTGAFDANNSFVWDNASGRLGLGTGSPADSLHIRLASGSAAFRLEALSDASYFNLINTTGAVINNVSNTPLVFTTNNVERMRINSSGNVGISTTSPGSTLDVKGTIRLSGATSGYVGLAPGAAAGSTTYTLPSADGTNGQLLSTNGSGTLSWVSPTSTTTQALADAARPICYSALTGNTDHSIIMVPLPAGATDLDSVCHTTINASWHAGGIAKPNYVNQNCDGTPLNNAAYGGGYTSYITEATYEGSVASFSNCGPTNAMICCSASFPN